MFLRPCRSSSRDGGSRVVRDFVGHGIGKQLHEEPQVPNFGSATGAAAACGMFGDRADGQCGVLRCSHQGDGWTAVTRTGTIGALRALGGDHRTTVRMS